MVSVKGRKSSNKNPPIFSHEFIIQNHADIVSCVAMVFVIGLMVQATSPWAYMFIAIHHNISVPQTDEIPVYLPPKYTTGWKDACAVFFYFLITIVMHAVIQEYLFDKISKRLHLSKSKLSKFNESGQLLVFFVISAIWGIDIILRDNLLLNVKNLWQDYPTLLSFSLKLFFISQLAYWLHCYPELYFQRVKKEDMLSRIIPATVGLIFTFAAYFLNYQHIGVVLLVLHYVGDAFLHGTRLIDFIYQKEHITERAYAVANVVYVLMRLVVIGFATLVFVYGLGKVEQSFDYNSGNFNVPVVRYIVFAFILIFQTYLLYAFFEEQIKLARENAAPVVTKVVTKSKSKQKQQKKKDNKKGDDDDLPEVDQATKKNLKYRTKFFK